MSNDNATLRGWRTLLDMCETAMLSDAELAQAEQWAEEPDDPDILVTATELLSDHDFALAILAALADAMGVTGGGK